MTTKLKVVKDNPALQKAYEAIKRAEENFDILEKFVENDTDNMTLLVLNIHNLVEKLIMGAAISSLGRYLSDKPMDFLNHDRDFTNYYTNRGEYTEIRHFKDFDDYNENHQYEEFEYIFTKDNVWSVFDGNDWHDLEYVIQEKGYTDPYDMKEEAA